MKNLIVDIKAGAPDFLMTEGYWFSSSVNQDGYRIIKRDNKTEILLGFFRGQDSPVEKITAGTSLRHDFEAMSKLEQNAALFYFNSHETQFLWNGKGSVNPVVFRRTTQDLLIPEKTARSVTVNTDDIVMFVGRDFPIAARERVALALKEEKRLTYPVFKAMETDELLDKNHWIPIATVEKSNHIAYSYPIRSSLRAVTSTIDMIKNKVLKHHSEKVWQIETVLHEALVNSITYGNEMDDTKNVTVSYEMGDRGLRVCITDEGEGFDVHNITVPVGEEALDRISGRGIYIMQKFSDALFFNEKGNELLLFFAF